MSGVKMRGVDWRLENTTALRSLLFGLHICMWGITMRGVSQQARQRVAQLENGARVLLHSHL